MKRFEMLSLAALVLVASGAARGQDALPEGNGRKLVQTYCVQCHGLSTITRSGYDAETWRNNLHMMINVGSALPQNEIEPLVQYLSKNFPERARPPAVIIPGSASVTITEWRVPTPGSRPHDPLAMADGSIWYTGQFANKLGRLNPKTGQIKEYPLPDKSGPHGLVADKDGNIWYTGNFKGTIGKLNPKAGEVTEYFMPNPAARDPHTPVFDKNGNLWFTVQVGNMIGRLDPQTGEIRLVTAPTPKSRPYGMVINSQNIPFFVEFGSNKIASIDANTMAIREYVLPHAQSRPRRIAITSDDVLWYSDYARGYLGRYDPATGKVNEWASPGGPRSQPYGIIAIRGVIWYSEAGVSPNTIVRFDPQTEKFQTWKIPSGGGVVRNVSLTKDGNIAIACSGVNRVGLVKLH